MSGLDVAVYHHLPTGGALRVLAEWTRHTSAARITVYTPDPSVHAFAALAERASVRALPARGPYEGLGAALGLLRSIPAGREAARKIDRGGHDVAFLLPSRLTQAPGVLAELETPALYYAPEPLRVAYEDPRLVYPGTGWKIALTRAGANPVERLRKLLDRRTMRRATHVVTHSQFTREDLRRIYGVEARVVRLGVDAEAFTPARDAEQGAPSVLSVGALHALKGHDLVIDAVARLPRAQRPPLVIVGDRGIEAPRIEARAAAAGVQLDLRSSVPFPEVVRLMQHATVVACAQVREPFGLVPLEAMACARPVVAVADGGLRESVLHEQTGLLVPRDPQAMADALQLLLDDRERRACFGAAGRAEVEASWSWDRYAAEIDRLLAERAQPRSGSAIGAAT